MFARWLIPFLVLAKRHFKRTKIAQELLVTEGTYVKNLAITIKVLPHTFSFVKYDPCLILSLSLSLLS
jgi:hypothetical protein